MQVGQEFIPFKLFLGAIIPNAILELEDLTPGAKLVYARLSQHAGRDGRCFPSQKTLAKEVGMSENAVQIAIDLLVKKGFIKRINPTGKERLEHASCEYKFLWHESFEAKHLTSEAKKEIKIEKNAGDTKTGTPEIENFGINIEKNNILSSDSNYKSKQGTEAPSENPIPENNISNDSSILKEPKTFGCPVCEEIHHSLEQVGTEAPGGNVPSIKDDLRQVVSENIREETFPEKVLRYMLPSKRIAEDINLQVVESMVDFAREHKTFKDYLGDVNRFLRHFNWIRDQYQATGGIL